MRRYYRAGYSWPHPDVNMNPDHFPSRHWPIDIAWLTFPMACNAAILYGRASSRPARAFPQPPNQLLRVCMKTSVDG